VTSEYYLGLDLGQKKSSTAIAVVERTVDREERRSAVTWELEWHELSRPRVAVRHWERIPLRTSYVEVVDRTRELVWPNQSIKVGQLELTEAFGGVCQSK